jgi:uncharacterized protein (TIGR02284 family)
METKVESINQLIIINNDRYEGYKKAAEEAKDQDLKDMFNKFSSQSKGFSEELKKFVDPDDLPKQNETTNSGKLYRVWMDIKSGMTANDRKAVLSSCEFGEDIAKKTYKEVMDNPEDISTEALNVIRKQNEEIIKGHDTVKAMRDSTK